MSRIFANNAATTLSGSLAASGAAQTVSITNGSAFPALTVGNTFMVTLDNLAGVYEILEVTAHSSGGTTMTVNRGREGTAIAAWNAGALIEMRVTALEYSEFVAETDSAVALQGTLSVAGATSLSTPLPIASGGTGAASHTSGAVLVGNATGALGYVEPGVAGDVLGTSDGTNWASVPFATLLTQSGIESAIATNLPVTKGGTGLSTLTDKALIVGAGTADVTFIAPGTSGQVLTSNGTTWAASALPSVAPRGYTIYTSNVVYTVPAGVTKIWVTAVGGGGGGQCGDIGAPGGDGAPGEYKYRQVFTVTPGQTVALTIGTGGAGSGVPGSSFAGTATVFGALLTCAAGAAGGYTAGVTTQPTRYARGVVSGANTGDGGAGSTYGYGSAAGSPGYIMVEWGLEA